MRKILLSLTALLLATGIVGAADPGVLGDLWDVEVSGDNYFSAGTLDLKVDGNDDPVVHLSTGEQLSPGDEGWHTFNATNVGCLRGFLTISVTGYTEGGGPHPEPEQSVDPTNEANLDEQLHIVFWQDDDNNGLMDLGEEVLLDGKVIDVLDNITDTIILTGYPLDPAPPKGNNNTKFLGFYWYVQEEDPENVTGADNDIMGDWLCFDIQFILKRKPPILRPQPGSQWTYETHYDDGSGYTDNTTWRMTLEDLDVMPYRMGPGNVTLPSLLSSRLSIDLDYGGTAPYRDPPDSYWREQHSFDFFARSSDGTMQYAYLLGTPFHDPSVPYEVEFSYTDYQLLSGANIGLPYSAGNAWKCTLHRQRFVGGTPYWVPAYDCTFVKTTTVTAAGVSVTVPAGTFDDCFEIVTSCSPVMPSGGSGEFYVDYWSPTAMAIVKRVNNSFVGVETQELSSYSLILG